MTPEEKKAQRLTTLQAMNAIELVGQKVNVVKALEKSLQSINSLNMHKASERQKLTKEMDKARDILSDLEVVESVLKEKDF